MDKYTDKCSIQNDERKTLNIPFAISRHFKIMPNYISMCKSTSPDYLYVAQILFVRVLDIHVNQLFPHLVIHLLEH